jgi:signal transduction histidine kinase
MVKPIAKEVLQMMRASLPAKIDIQNDIQSDAYIMGDPTHIHQILMNLCTNAGHAMQPDGGTLTLRLHDAQLDQSYADQDPDIAPGPHVQITVADTGHGIKSEALEKIFDPFFTTKKPGEGTGMGLSVVHGIVKQLGGSLRVSSEPGEGTEFNIYLPAMERYEAITLQHENALP